MSSTLSVKVAADSRPSIGPGVGFSLLAAATFGSSGSMARPLLAAGWSPGAIVLVRIASAALLLLIPALRSLRGRWPLLRSRLGLVAVFGVLAVAGAQVCFFNAVQHVSVGVALLLEYSGVLLVVGWQWARTRIRPVALTFVGAVVAVAGLMLVLDVFGALHLSIVGVLWGFGASIGLAVYYVIAARTEDGLPPLAVVTVGMVFGTAALGLAALVRILPLAFRFSDVQLAGVTMTWLLPALWLGVVAAAVAYVSGVEASRRLGSTVSSFFGLTEVLFAVLFAWLLLSEVPGAGQLAGGVLVLIGVVLVRLGELRSPSPGADPPQP
ncbi:MAG: DMT family transporter [Actinomycetota bacterium]|nr:DMT family transporter [Actinomycetota bacterium]